MPNPTPTISPAEAEKLKAEAKAWWRQCSPHIKQRKNAILVERLLSLLAQREAEIEELRLDRDDFKKRYTEAMEM